MTNREDHGELGKQVGNSKLFAGGGLLLFLLGLMSWFMAMAGDGVTEGRMTATLSSVLLLAMGYPMLLYVAIQKQLKSASERIDQLERRVAARDQPDRTSTT